MNDRARTLIRILLSLLMTAAGVITALMAQGSTGPNAKLSQDLGLALIIAGVVAFFQEAFVAPLRQQEADERLKDVVKANESQLGELSKSIKGSLTRVFDILAGPGIQMVSKQRRGYSGYHRWMLETAPQEMFFAGHSVLHRIQADFGALKLKDVDEALFQKLAEGGKVKILFLDPTWDFLENIARSEDQTAVKMAQDLLTTLQVCENLSRRLGGVDLPGELDIRTCGELVQYAFHHVACPNKSEEMLIGFYFAGMVGTQSPLLSVENRDMREFFSKHFFTIFDRSSSKRLLSYSRGAGVDFNENYCLECKVALGRWHRGGDNRATGTAA